MQINSFEPFDSIWGGGGSLFSPFVSNFSKESEHYLRYMVYYNSCNFTYIEERRFRILNNFLSLMNLNG